MRILALHSPFVYKRMTPGNEAQESEKMRSGWGETKLSRHIPINILCPHPRSSVSPQIVPPTGEDVFRQVFLT